MINQQDLTAGVTLVAEGAVGLDGQSEKIFRQAVESAPNAIVIVDPRGAILIVNAQTEKLFGYSRQELLGQQVEILLPEEFRSKHFAHRSDFLDHPQAGAMGAGRELYGLRKDGSRFPVEIGLNPIPLDGGICVIASIVDITERKRAEQLFRLAVEAAPNAMVMVNQEGSIILVNAQTEKLFGYTREELAGQKVEILIPPEFRERHPGLRGDFLAQPRVRAMGAGRELYGLRKDGARFPIEIGLNPIRVDNGFWTLSSIVDITAGKEAEEMLRLSVEAAPNGMVIVDEEGKIVLVNTQTEKLFGYTREELIGREVEVLVPKPFQGRHGGQRSTFMRDPRARAMGAGRDLYGQRKDGTRFPVEIGLNPIRTPNGRWILSSIVDITGRKRIEEELRRSEELYRLLVENVKDYAILMLDPEGRIRSCNAGAQAITGYPAAEIVGRHISELYAPEDAPRSLAETLLRKAASEGRAENEGLRTRKDGSRFWAQAVITPVLDAGGALYGFVKVSQDITDRKRAQEEIARLNLDLERRVRERTAELTAALAELEAFSYSVAHDLRAPLRQISGFSTIFSEDYGDRLDAEAQRFLRKIQGGAEHMGQLIDGLLNLARIGRQPLAMRSMPVNDLAALAVEDLRAEWAAREVDWQIESLGWIVCEPLLIKQVFVNLFSNALKYSRKLPRSTVHVSRTADGNHAVFCVRDNGVGFDKRYEGKLFKVFERLHRAQEYEGTGVGLATVNRIVRRHGGRVWAESEPGCGAAFFISLPSDGIRNTERIPGELT